MENLYSINPTISCSDEIAGVGNVALPSRFHRRLDNLLQFEPGEAEICGSEMSDLIKAQIANHPRYPNLVSAYIECRKVGASPKLASLLEEIGRESYPSGACSTEIGMDPELDEFMESYCEVLHKYKEELSKPFHEATTFLSNIETQLSNLCNITSTATTTTSGNSHSDLCEPIQPYYTCSFSVKLHALLVWCGNIDDGAATSEEELSCGAVEATESQEPCEPLTGDKELKEMLLRKYSGYLSSLRKEFLKKRKKGKLPKDARMTLLDWWNAHYRWPYPTEEEKMKLAEITGLDQKQINNWFINQRKRHWKPSEDVRFALMEGVGGGSNIPPMYFDSGGRGTASDDL